MIFKKSYLNLHFPYILDPLFNIIIQHSPGTRREIAGMHPIMLCGANAFLKFCQMLQKFRVKGMKSASSVQDA